MSLKLLLIQEEAFFTGSRHGDPEDCSRNDQFMFLIFVQLSLKPQLSIVSFECLKYK